jgi:ribonuclease BN (tRNA processing enzyme)
VRRAAAATGRLKVAALEAPKLNRVFLTHLHSDHTMGLPDLIFTLWVLGRKEPLDLYGPTGTTAMAGHLEAAWEQDIDVRVHGLERANATGYQVTATTWKRAWSTARAISRWPRLRCITGLGPRLSATASTRPAAPS